MSDDSLLNLLEKNIEKDRALQYTSVGVHKDDLSFTIAGQHHKVVCRLEVKDNGPGVSKDLKERIFFPMISGRAGGSGLGLTIAQTAVNGHQGIIECESEPGNTRFSMYLPIKV